MDGIAAVQGLVADLVENHPEVEAALLGGSAVRSTAYPVFDLDLKLLVGDPEQCAGLVERLVSTDVGVRPDVSLERIVPYLDVETVIGDQWIWGFFQDAAILFDRSGRLLNVQSAAVGRCMELGCVKARLAPSLRSIQRNAQELWRAVDDGDVPQICRAAIFALWTACDVWLIRYNRPPTAAKGLFRLQQVKPDERAKILELEDARPIDADGALSLLALLERSTGDWWRGPHEQEAGNKIAWLATHGYPREARHAAWISVGLFIKEHPLDAAARSLAEAWLDRVGWTGPGQAANAGAVARYGQGVCRRLGHVGQHTVWSRTGT
jgi:hypothetical protein